MSAPIRKQLLLQPGDVRPSRADLEVAGIFNPGATEFDGDVVLLARVAERPRDRPPNELRLPRWDPAGNIVVDRYSATDVDTVDSRVVHIRETQRRRLTFTSHIHLVNCGPSGTDPQIKPTVFSPQGECEEFGVEDPRITRLGERYYITYVAVSRHGAATALASTIDFNDFTRHGIIFPPENKDVVLFPERIGNRYCAIHRPTGATPFTSPEMWIAWSHDLSSWGHHEPLVVAEGRSWASGRVGAGAPPIRVDAGWLVIYHANRRPAAVGQVGQYVAAALLLDAENPSRILAQSADELFAPTESFERDGFVPDVAFPTGTVARGDRLMVYYGAGDTNIALADVSIKDVLNNLAQPR
jgi:predicted GH43/DUF377 family glycosyl hydrolase